MSDNNVIEAGFQPPPPEPASEDLSLAIQVLSQWRRILNARLLALLSLLGAMGIFGVTINDPTILRLIGASLYSIGVLWPVMWLFTKKG